MSTTLTKMSPESVDLNTRLAAEFATAAEVELCLEAFELDCLSRRDRRGVFATAYLQITRAISAALEESFFDDFERVIIGLAHRIQREEEILYPLYATGCITEASVRASDPAHGFEPIGSDPHHDDLARGGELHRE